MKKKFVKVLSMGVIIGAIAAYVKAWKNKETNLQQEEEEMKVRPTCTDSAGNGHYQGTDGEIYYGNVKMDTFCEKCGTRLNSQKVFKRQRGYSAIFIFDKRKNNFPSAYF